MNNTVFIIALIAGILSLIAYLIYIYNIWWGETRPSKSSWWILTVVWTVTFLATYSSVNRSDVDFWKSVILQGLQVSYIIGSLLIGISSIWKSSTEKWSKDDTNAAVLAVVALVIYVFLVKIYTTTWAAILSLLIATLADFCGLIPTIKNAKENPWEEHKFAWTLETSACILGLIGVLPLIWHENLVSVHSIAVWLSPLYLVIVNFGVTYYIYVGRTNNPKL